MTDKMFDTEYLKQHMGDYAKELNPDVAKLEPIVEALKEKTKTLGIEVEHDVTALENPYFKTFNYTSYAGFLTVHPLQPEHSARQMLDAWYSDESEANHDWYDWSVDRINNKQASKYNIKSTKIIPNKIFSLVVLPGGNKLKKHICIGQLENIADFGGPSTGMENGIFWKAHPITKLSEVSELNERLGGEFAVRDGYNLYELMERVEQIVYTSHLSESAWIASVMGKKIVPIDKYQARAMSSFFHINHFLFSEPNPIEFGCKAFNDYRSGIFQPDIDKDWEEKLDKYLAYISERRIIQHGFYQM
jgi:hypothetical protein